MGKGGKSEGGEEENMAAWLVAINTLKIQPFNLPPLGPHDVKVRMKAVGICGSDVHYLKTLRCADFIVKEPMVIGHECAGVIEEVGTEVKDLVVGDRVALEPGISCWRCTHCKQGRYNLCPDMKFFATPPVHGSLANQFAPCGEQNGKTNNLDGVRGGEQTGKKTETSGSKMAIFKGLEQNR